MNPHVPSPSFSNDQLMVSSLIYPVYVHLTQISYKIFHNLYLGPVRISCGWFMHLVLKSIHFPSALTFVEDLEFCSFPLEVTCCIPQGHFIPPCISCKMVIKRRGTVV